MKEKSISVIVPNYNGAKLLKRYLPYTLAALGNISKWEVIVVDDASTDGSVEFIKSTYPDVVLVQNKTNSGFSFTCNAGMEVAKYNYILFLNSDIKLTPGYFENQWPVFDHDDTFGVMGRILEMESGEIEVASKYPKKMGNKYKISSQFYFSDEGKFAPTAFLSGANALVDAEKMKFLGGFDTVFSPFYFEDLDLGTRAWRMGWKCFYDHHSICYHLGSCTIKQENLKKGIKEIYFRNRLIFHGIHLHKSKLSHFRLQTLLLEVLPKVGMGQFWIYKSYKAFLQYEEQIEQSRAKLENQMSGNQSNISLFDLIKLMDKEMAKEKTHWL